jgi:tRNA (adenine57-N1/adenine58-N1)-methyltransferase
LSNRFAVGDRVLLLDSKRRRHLVTLADEGRFHSHSGIVDHAQLIGHPEGTTVRSTAGARYVALRPTLSELVLEMPRGAQVIYPKDLGAILMAADIFAGVKVVEAGVGSGALSMALLRAGAEVVGYEVRPDFAARAASNVDQLLDRQHARRFRMEQRDVYDGIAESGVDRVVLDLPEPWRVVPHAETAMHPGGILLAYLPTIGQVTQLRQTLAASAFGLAETVEVLQRTWHVEGRSVRPDHRMVGHTGFLTHARLLLAEEGTDGSPPST